MGAFWTQVFPPPSVLTERNLPTQAKKVFIITGANCGVGFELSKILYGAGATVYMAGRSYEKTKSAIVEIEEANNQLPVDQKGRLEFLKLDLSDLSSIKSTAEEFLLKEKMLHVLWNNAGIAQPPSGLKSAQGLDIQLATNCLGAHLLTSLLTPALQAAAAELPPGEVRVVWTSSQMVDMMAPKSGLDMKDVCDPSQNRTKLYCYSKTGNWYLASELGRRVAGNGILSVTQNPGNLKTQILRSSPRILVSIANLWLYPAKQGAYTELYAGLSTQLTMKDQGGYIVPFGRKHPAPRVDLLLSLKSKEEGGNGRAAYFWDWCEQMVKEYK